MPNENHEYSLNYINQKGRKGGLLASDGGRWWEWPHYDKDTVCLLGNSYFTPNISLNTRLYYDTFYNELNIFGNVSNAQRPTTALSPSNVSIYDDDTLGGIITLAYDTTPNINVKFGANLKKDHHFAKDGAGVKSVDLDELATSIFAQYAQRIPIADESSFRFVFASSYDRLDTFDVYSRQDNATDDARAKTDIKGGFSLQGALYYDISQSSSVHFSVAKKENLPTIKDRYTTKWGNYASNADLKPESAINYELGYDFNFNDTQFSVVGFYNDMTDMFYDSLIYENRCANYATAGTGRNPKPTNSCYQRINTDKGYTYGGEISVEQGFFDNKALIVGGNYSFTQMKTEGVAVDSFGRSKITDYPNHIFNAKIAIRPTQRLEFVGLSILESARYYTSENGSYVKNNNYFTLDFNVHYELEKGFIINAGVLNFTDRDNFLGSNLPSKASHLAGRRFVVGFDYNY